MALSRRAKEQLLFPTPPKTLMRAVGVFPPISCVGFKILLLTLQLKFSAPGQAIHTFKMIREGDKVLLGLSGGKDSLSLLHVLYQLTRRAPVRFELAAVTMNPQFPGFDPSPLVPYLKSLGIRYFFESHPLLELAQKTKPTSICAWCSRMKREFAEPESKADLPFFSPFSISSGGILYSTARREGFNVLALGQHLDDFAESFVMSAFHNGRLGTMKAHYLNQVNG